MLPYIVGYIAAAVQRLRNTLNLRHTRYDQLYSYRRHLKAHLFRTAAHCDFALYKYTYLLTRITVYLVVSYLGHCSFSAFHSYRLHKNLISGDRMLRSTLASLIVSPTVYCRRFSLILSSILTNDIIRSGCACRLSSGYRSPPEIAIRALAGRRFSFYAFYTLCLYFRWRGGATGTELDLRSTGRGLKSYLGQRCITTLGKLFTPMCLCHQAV